MTLIKLENIYFGNTEKTIIHVPSLEIKKGEIVGVIGPNGSGKSTLFKVISMLETDITGDYYFEGVKINPKDQNLEIRRRMSYVMQKSYLFTTTVYENVAAGLKVREVPKAEIAAKTEFWLDRLGITHLAKRYPENLSGGEAQRVNLARALATDPEILFLDEPFTGLDYPTKVDIITELKEIIAEKHITCFFVSHELNEIEFLTDRLIVIKNGEKAFDGDTAGVITEGMETDDYISKLKQLELK